MQSMDMRRGAAKIRCAGFTLIELLVSISLIVLLIAILLPALGQSRTSSQRMMSLSNIRQITIALHSYAGDSRDSMPFVRQKKWDSGLNTWVDDRFSTVSRQWSRVLFDLGYLKTIDVYWSPARETYGDPWPHTKRTDNQESHSFESVGYGLSTAVSPSSESEYLLGTGQLPLRLGEFKAPPAAKMILLAETFSTASDGGMNGLFTATPTRATGNTGCRLFNYGGAVVRSYIDGHAQANSALKKSGTVGSADTHPSELGWQIDRPPNSGLTFQGQFAGYWAFQSTTQFSNFTPWYTSWRN